MRALRLLLVVVVLALVVVVVWIAGDFVGVGAMNRVADEQWPAGLGTLSSVEAWVQPQKTNDAALRLVALAQPLGIPFARSIGKEDPIRSAIGAYLKEQQVRSDATIAAAPQSVIAYLDAHEAHIDALRDHLLQSDAIRWEMAPARGFDAPIPNLLGHMHVARVLCVRALVRARSNDVRAWGDLHAMSRLTRSLESRPEMICQLIRLALSRMLNAAAWKLPAGGHAWLAELRAVDDRHLLLGAMQHDSWMLLRYSEGSTQGPLSAIARPYMRFAMVSATHHELDTAREVASMTACALDGEAFSQRRKTAAPRWNVFARVGMLESGGIWQRMFRAAAEREAAANAMRVAQGQPIVTTSACSDGAWSFDGHRLSFSRELPASSPTEVAMPLSLVLR
jgi:hypothetical protein